MITVGVDPGLTGAIAVLKNGEYLALIDMPTTLKGGGGSVKYEINPTAILQFLRANIPATEACKCLIERVNSMPGQAASTVFSLGDSYGSARAVLACAGFAYDCVVPTKWKKYFGLSSEKEESRSLATKLFPTAELHLKRHHDRAEALLLSLYLYQTEFQ